MGVRPPADDGVARPPVDAQRWAQPRGAHGRGLPPPVRVGAGAPRRAGAGPPNEDQHQRHATDRTPDIPLSRGAPTTGRAGPARDRGRGGSTRSHPEPGRETPQRRRVLRPRAVGDAAVAGGPRPRPSPAPYARRGVEQRQLVGLITRRSGVRIPPPLPPAPRAPPHQRGGPRRFRPRAPSGAPIGQLHLSHAARSAVCQPWPRNARPPFSHNAVPHRRRREPAFHRRGGGEPQPQRGPVRPGRWGRPH